MTTQNCAECGTRAEPGQSFCDACGAVLNWDRDARAAQPAAPPSPSPSPPPSPSPSPSPSPVSGPAADAVRNPPAAVPAPRTAGAAGAPAAGDASRTAGAAHAVGHGAGSAPGGPQGAGAADGRQVPGSSGAPAPAPGAPGGTHPAGPPAVPGTAGHTAPDGRPGQPGGPGGPGPAAAGRAVDDGRPAGPAPARPAAPAPARPDTPAAGPAPETPVPHPLSDTMSDRARSLLVPVADPEEPRPAPGAAGPVLPGRPDADRPAVRAPGEQPGLAGGPPCRWCATPNRPDRHYCVRCAMPLAESGEAAAPARAPWWRRLFGGGRRETPWAGDRPRLRRVFDRVGTWITLAVVVTVAVLGFVYLPDGVRAALDHFAKRAPVAPDRITASRSYPGHQPELAFDKRSNTWWGPGVSQSGQGEWIEVGFSEPARLLDVIITPGVSARADRIGESALPHRVTATITGKDGKVTTRRLTLDQGAGGQRRPFRVGEVTKVRFTVDSAHAASADKQVAIAEIEFFGPSNAGRS